MIWNDKDVSPLWWSVLALMLIAAISLNLPSLVRSQPSISSQTPPLPQVEYSASRAPLAPQDLSLEPLSSNLWRLAQALVIGIANLSQPHQLEPSSSSHPVTSDDGSALEFAVSQLQRAQREDMELQRAALSDGWWRDRSIFPQRYEIWLSARRGMDDVLVSKALAQLGLPNALFIDAVASAAVSSEVQPQQGDQLLAINGERVFNQDDWKHHKRQQGAAELTLLRNGKAISFWVEDLGDRFHLRSRIIE